MPKVQVETHNFSKEELVQLKAVFDSIDADGNGRLDETEFSNFLSQNGMDPKQAKMAIFLFDADKNGTIEWNEFLAFMDAINAIATDPTKLFRLIFDAIDSDHSGSLNRAEIKQVSELFGQPISEQDLDDMFATLDTNHTGTLEFPEVVRAFGF